MSYAGVYTPQTMSHSLSSRGGYPTPRTPGPGFDDFSRYPYGDPVFDDGDREYAGFEDNYRSPSRAAYSRSGSYYGGAHDDMSINRRPSYYGGGTDLDYAVPLTGSSPYSATNSAIMPSRSRRNSFVGMQPSMSSMLPGSAATHSVYEEGYQYRNKVPRIKFRSQHSNSGMSLADAINGVRPGGSDRYKWHELHADRNGEIYLRVAWNGYRSVTYRVPVDWYENRIRMSSLVRRVGRAIVHYLRANAINTPWETIKIYSIEEVSYGTWQPQLTVKAYSW